MGMYEELTTEGLIDLLVEGRGVLLELRPDGGFRPTINAEQDAKDWLEKVVRFFGTHGIDRNWQWWLGEP